MVNDRQWDEHELEIRGTGRGAHILRRKGRSQREAGKYT